MLLDSALHGLDRQPTTIFMWGSPAYWLLQVALNVALQPRLDQWKLQKRADGCANVNVVGLGTPSAVRIAAVLRVFGLSRPRRRIGSRRP